MDFPLLGSDYDLTGKGERGAYVSSVEWNALIKDPSVLVLDTRNDYEVEVGTFENSINPNTKSFKDFPEFVSEHLPDKNTTIAMFCTGIII